MKLSFSTKGWHDNDFDGFCDIAKDLKFSGIELHNIHNRLFTDKDGAFHDYAAAKTLRKLYEMKLQIPCIDTICNLADTSAKEEAFTKITNDQYIPQPIDTSAVQLPGKLDVLGELIAKNVHEVWAQSRMEEGWTYGKERNDELKQHPCLIPYEDLPEEEKAYDRNTAFGTLKLISKLGFKISKRGNK